MNDKTMLRRIKDAKARVAFNHHPMFGAILVTLNLMEDVNGPCMATNGRDLRYNPALIKTWTLQEIESVLIHEACHVAYLHHCRLGYRDSLLANMAMDYAINNILVKFHHISLPEGALVNHEWNGLAWESIYDLLERDKRVGQDTNDGDNGLGDWNIGGIEPYRGDIGPASTSELRDQEQQVTQLVHQAHITAKRFGSCPGSSELEELLSSIMAPDIGLKEELRRFMEQSFNTRGMSDYAFMRPNVRYLHSGIYLPSMIDNSLRDIVFAIDTSGSVDNELLTTFFSIVSDVCGDMVESCYVVQCDAAIQDIARYEKADFPITVKVAGRGGTDFCPVFDWIDAKELNPPCVVYFTDLYGFFPANPPDYPVLWVCNDTPEDWRSRMDDEAPPFGEVILFTG